MASYSYTSGSYTLTLTVTETSTSTQTNSSTLSWSLVCKKISGSGLYNNNACPWSVTINGSTPTGGSGSTTYNFANYDTLSLGSGSGIQITHENDGSKTIAVSASFNMDNTPYVPNVLAPSGSMTLTVIPRAGEVSVSAHSIVNTTSSLKVQITSKADYYYKWRWRIGDSWTGISFSELGRINSKTINMAILNSALLEKMPETSEGEFTVQLRTYSDSQYSNQIGSTTATAHISVSLEYIKPTLSADNAAIKSGGFNNQAIAGFSVLQVGGINATGGSGTSGITLNATCTYGTMAVAQIVNTSSNTLSNQVMYTNTLPSKRTDTSNVSITITAVDSRGGTTSVTKTWGTVEGYKYPTANLKAYRASLRDGQWVADGASQNVYVESVSFSYDNTISGNGWASGFPKQLYTLSSGLSNTYQEGRAYTVNINTSATFTLEVKDKIGGSSIARVDIGNATYPIILRDDGLGNVGVGFGIFPDAGVTAMGLITQFFSTNDIQLDSGTTIPAKYLFSIRTVSYTSDFATISADIGSGVPFMASVSDTVMSTLAGVSTSGVLLGKFYSGGFDYVASAGNNGNLVIGRYVTASDTATYTVYAKYNDLFYKNGDTFVNRSGDRLVCSGFLNTAMTNAIVELPMPKRLDNVSSVSCTVLTGYLRGVQGFLTGSSSVVDFKGTGYTVTPTIRHNNVVELVISPTSAFTNGVANTPICLHIATITLSFS